MGIRNHLGLIETWDVLKPEYDGCIQTSPSINRNMRCIETMEDTMMKVAVHMINRNMRCIETKVCRVIVRIVKD